MRPIVSLLIAIAAASISGQNKLATALSTVSKSSSTSRIRNSSSQTLSSLMFPLLESSTVEKEKISLLPGSETSSNNLSPFLQGMVDEQRELQMNVGKAMDTLRKDYPYFLKRAPGKFCFMRVTPHTNNYSFLFVDLTEKHLNSFIFRLFHLSRQHITQSIRWSDSTLQTYLLQKSLGSGTFSPLSRLRCRSLHHSKSNGIRSHTDGTSCVL